MNTRPRLNNTQDETSHSGRCTDTNTHLIRTQTPPPSPHKSPHPPKQNKTHPPDRRGSQVLVRLGDKEVDVSPDFRLYITTRLPNPTYPPEVTTKVAVINFAVKPQGLEGQLLAAVVRHERPDLDAQRNELVVKVGLFCDWVGDL